VKIKKFKVKIWCGFSIAYLLHVVLKGGSNLFKGRSIKGSGKKYIYWPQRNKYG